MGSVFIIMMLNYITKLLPGAAFALTIAAGTALCFRNNVCKKSLEAGRSWVNFASSGRLSVLPELLELVVLAPHRLSGAPSAGTSSPIPG